MEIWKSSGIETCYARTPPLRGGGHGGGGRSAQPRLLGALPEAAGLLPLPGAPGPGGGPVGTPGATSLLES